MKKFVKAVIAGALGAAPVFAFAQETTFLGLLDQISGIANATVPFIIGLAVVVIVWGVFNYIVGAGDEEKRAEAKKYIIWGIIGVFIMLSVWGLVNVLANSFALRRTPPALIPGVIPQPTTAVGSPCTIPATGTVGTRQTDGTCK